MIEVNAIGDNLASHNIQQSIIYNTNHSGIYLLERLLTQNHYL
jgi:hypothetical protein